MRSMMAGIVALITLFTCLPLAAQTAAPTTAQAAAPHSAALIAIDGAIGPPVASFVERALGLAAQQKSPFVVLRLDTPGGLSTSMRTIIKDLLAAPMPVVCWVGPKGARAASAGTYILYACDIAAMAPGTNVGAATPVMLSASGGSKTPAKPKTAEQTKVLNDAIAYITSLAQGSGRNAEWAQTAVRDGASISAKDALKKNVVNFIAADLPALLTQLNGTQVSTPSGPQTLQTTGLTLQQIQPTWKEHFLAVLTNPSLAYILLMIGIFGLILEGMHPGFVLPGTVGAVCLILGLFAMSILPVSWAGLALIILGVVLLVSEAFAPSFGALGLGGIIAFVIGSMMLFKSPAPGFTLPLVYIGTAAFVAAIALLGLMYMLLKMRKRPVVSGPEAMIGITVTALSDFDTQGYVLAAGERWRAITTGHVNKGDKLVVDALDQLTLKVHAKSTTDVSPPSP